MKKTLLCFLFLFTTVFYAQDIVHCPGDNNFDLAKQKPLLIGNLNPDETTVSFHLNLADATNNINAIANPSNYNASVGSTIIYVRIDNNGTITTNSFNIKVIATLNITTTHTAILCAGDKSSLTVSASAGSGQYLYSINGGSFSSNPTFNNLSAGVYSIQVLDTGTSCPTTVIYTITAPTTLNTTAMVSGQMATITAIGGAAPYKYSLEGINYQSSPIFTNLAPGNHVFMVKDLNGCIATVQATILPALTVTAVITKEMDCTANTNASIAVAATGGQSPYTYSLNGSPFQINNNFSNLVSGTYSITAKDAVNSVSNPTAITINPLVALSATALVTNPTNCSIGTITAIATGGKAPYIYSFDGGSTFITSNIFGTPNPGTYVIIVKDSKGCLSPSITKTINPAQKPTIAAANTPILCAGETSALTIVANGDAPFQYSINDGAYTSSNVFTKLKAGNYLIKVQDANGCIIALPHVISEPEIVYGDILIDGQTISVIDVKGGTGSYQYAIDNGTFQTNNVFTNVNPGIHNIRLKDSNNCEPGSFSAVVADENTLISTAAITKQINCNSNAQITVTAYGGKAPYLYSIDGGITYQESNVFDNLAAGTYTVNVQDTSPAVSDVNIIVIDPLVTLTATASHTPIVCRGSFVPVTVNASGGQAPYQYALKDDIYTNNNEFTDVKAGTYTIKVKDAYGCIFILPYVIEEPARMIGKGVLEGKTASIINVTGGSGSYLYSLNDGPLQANNIFPNLGGDFNYISVYDSLGCFGFGIGFDMTGSTDITSQIAITKTIDCESNAAIAITAAGGLSPYSYSIDGGTTYQATNTFTNLIAGTYNATVKDANNSTKTNTFIIPPYSSLITSVNYRNVSCIGSNDGSAEIIATGGVAPYLYSIDNGAYSSSTIFSSLAAGDYTLNVKDAAGCLTTSDIRIIQPEAIFISATITNTTASNDDGKITVTSTGGVAPYTYALSNESGMPITSFQSSNSFNGLKYGIYHVQVKDANGCIASKTDISIINKINTLSATINTVQATCNNPFGTINVNATGGTPPYIYSFDNGTTFSISNVFYGSPGTYLIKVKDAENFEASTTIILNATTPITTTAILIKAIDCTSNAIINVAATGGKPPYLYSFDGGSSYVSTNTFSNAIAGNYLINVKDSNDCIATATLILNPYTALTATQIVTNATCAGMANGATKIQATGGVSPYIYSLNGNPYQTSNIFNNLVAGTYNGTIKDAAGCLVTFPFTITQPTPLSLSNVVANSKTLNSVDGTITITASGGTAPYQYVLKYENGSQIVGPQSSSVFAGLSVGKYTIEVTDGAGCKVNKSGILITSDTIFGTLMTTPITCTTLGTITINAAGGKYPHQYSFNNGITYGSSNIASNLQAGTYTIKVKDAGGDILTLSTSLTPVNPVVATTAITSPIHCNGSNDAVIQITATGGKAPYLYSINGSPYQSSNTFSNLYAGNHIITVKDSNGCSSVMALAITEPAVLVSSIEVINQTVTVNSSGGSGAYKYAISPNLNQFSTNNTFSNLAPGTYSIVTSDLNGCNVMLNFVINPPAPLIESKDAITVDFKPGQTLADLIVEGQNIKWYSTPNALEGKTSKTNETSLPLTTILVNGTTYYASQTINGIESKERLAVTAKLNGSLSAPDFVLPNFKYYPNPVLHNLTISNSSIIDEVEIVSATGQSILSKKVNSEYSEIDLSNVSSGLYFLKVKSEGKMKTVKIVKK